MRRVGRVIGPTDGEVGEKVRRIKNKASRGEHLTEDEEDVLEVSVRANRPMILVDGTVKPMSSQCTRTFPQWWAFVSHSIPYLGSVGRFDIPDGESTRSYATAFLLAPTLAVTNRHVVEDLSPETLVRCKISFGLDQLGGYPAQETTPVRVTELSDLFDLAVLRLDRAVETYRPLPLSSFAPPVTRRVAVIGFPAAKGEDEAAVDHLLEGVYNHLRISPGTVIGQKDDETFHDCSTFGGSSGSPMVDMATGHLIGVQFDGSYMVQNKAASRHAIRYLQKTAAFLAD